MFCVQTLSSILIEDGQSQEFESFDLCANFAFDFNWRWAEPLCLDTYFCVQTLFSISIEDDQSQEYQSFGLCANYVFDFDWRLAEP